MQTNKMPGEPWSFTDVARALGRQRGSVFVQARRVLPERLLEKRAGRGAAVQLPESVGRALVATLRYGLVDAPVVEALKSDPKAVLAAADALAELARLHMAEELQNTAA